VGDERGGETAEVAEVTVPESRGGRRRVTPLVATAALLTTVGWGLHHWWADLADREVTNLEFIVLAAFVSLVYTNLLPYLQRDARATPGRRRLMRRHERILTIVPAHNEDPAMFTAMLDSLLRQTVRPAVLHVVENGNPGYTPTLGSLVDAWVARHSPPFTVRYSFNPVGDKRLAQVVALRACPDATIHMTLDSDVELGDERVIESGVESFADRRVMSVCGLLLGVNQRRRILTRLIDLGFVGSFLNGRAAYSLVNSVSVNTGGLAFYRASVMNRYVDHYLGHRIFGRRMSYGDDAMWTRYALLEGRAVFQRSAWGYTLHPENWKHLVAQRTRWHRSWFWGNLWLIRNFSPRRVVWWLTLYQLTSFVWFTAAIPLVVVVAPLVTGQVAWLFIAWAALVSYLTSLPYLTVRRPDMRLREQVVNWSLAPLAAGLNMYIGWALRYAGMVTCLRTGWGTREHVEVGRPVAPAGELTS